jgi:hypothetical protein|tara:strand:+ start:2175 stop:2390 length:216 start_codon:yes stop_codon:yes gene_type:complete
MALGDGIGNLNFDKVQWYFNQLGVAFDNTLVMLFTKIPKGVPVSSVRVKFPTAVVMSQVTPPTAPTYTRVP